MVIKILSITLIETPGYKKYVRAGSFLSSFMILSAMKDNTKLFLIFRKETLPALLLWSGRPMELRASATFREYVFEGFELAVD